MVVDSKLFQVESNLGNKRITIVTWNAPFVRETFTEKQYILCSLGTLALRIARPSINYKNISLNVLHSICQDWVLDVTSIVPMKNVTYFKSLFLFLQNLQFYPL